MNKIIFITIATIVLVSCKTHIEPGKSKNNDCFSTENFTKVKEYIIMRIKNSGMGKLYIEYPEDKSKPNDGIMRPSKHPENLYDTYYDEVSGEIIFKGSNVKFIYNSTKGLINKENISGKDIQLANEIFCHLLHM